MFRTSMVRFAFAKKLSQLRKLRRSFFPRNYVLMFRCCFPLWTSKFEQPDVKPLDSENKECADNLHLSKPTFLIEKLKKKPTNQMFFCPTGCSLHSKRLSCGHVHSAHQRGRNHKRRKGKCMGGFNLRNRGELPMILETNNLSLSLL